MGQYVRRRDPHDIPGIDAYLQQGADKDGDMMICYKLIDETRLPAPAQDAQDGSVHFIDARSAAR